MVDKYRSIIEDLDNIIDGKNSEIDTLTRSINALSQQHKSMKLDFDKELVTKSAKTEAELDDRLKNRRKDLSDIENDILRHKEIIANLTKQSISEQNNLKLAQECGKTQKNAIDKEITGLSTTKDSLNLQISSAKSEVIALQTEKTTIQTEIANLNNSINVVSEKLAFETEEINQVDFKLEELKRTYDFESANNENNEKLAQSRLNDINRQLQNATQSLQVLKSEEDTLRQDFADWSMKLTEKESQLRMREERVNAQEKRVFNYAKFTGL